MICDYNYTIIITGSIITIIIWVVNTCIIIIHRALDLEKKCCIFQDLIQKLILHYEQSVTLAIVPDVLKVKQ